MSAFDRISQSRPGGRLRQHTNSTRRIRQAQETQHRITVNGVGSTTTYTLFVKGNARNVEAPVGFDQVHQICGFHVIAGSVNAASDEFVIEGPIAKIETRGANATWELDGQAVTDPQQLVSQTGGEGISVPPEMPDSGNGGDGGDGGTGGQESNWQEQVGIGLLGLGIGAWVAGGN